MSLKSTFLALKKVVQVVQIGGRGGGSGKNPKEQLLFYGRPSLTLEADMNVHVQSNIKSNRPPYIIENS